MGIQTLAAQGFGSWESPGPSWAGRFAKKMLSRGPSAPKQTAPHEFNANLLSCKTDRVLPNRSEIAQFGHCRST